MKKMEFAKIDLSTLDVNNYLVVVSFDIKDNQNRYRINKFLRNYGHRVQFSVYECIVNNYYYLEICKNIVNYVDNDDKIRIYKLTSKIEIKDKDKIDIKCFNKTYIV